MRVAVFFYSFTEYLLNTCFFPGTILGIQDTSDSSYLGNYRFQFFRRKIFTKIHPLLCLNKFSEFQVFELVLLIVMFVFLGLVDQTHPHEGKVWNVSPVSGIDAVTEYVFTEEERARKQRENKMKGDQRKSDGFTESALVLELKSPVLVYLHFSLGLWFFTVIVVDFGSVENSLKQLGNHLLFFFPEFFFFNGFLRKNLFCSLNLALSSSFQIHLQSCEILCLRKIDILIIWQVSLENFLRLYVCQSLSHV